MPAYITYIALTYICYLHIYDYHIPLTVVRTHADTFTDVRIYTLPTPPAVTVV